MPSVEDIKRFFVKKYDSLHDNQIHFKNDKSVMSLAKLLQVFHDHKEPFDISMANTKKSQMFYHPCLRYNTSTTPTNCTFYSLHERQYKNIFCTECQFNKSIDMRERKRVAQTPTRTRPFTKLSPDEKVHTYENRYKRYKSIARRY